MNVSQQNPGKNAHQQSTQQEQGRLQSREARIFLREMEGQRLSVSLAIRTASRLL